MDGFFIGDFFMGFFGNHDDMPHWFFNVLLITYEPVKRISSVVISSVSNKRVCF